MKAKTTWVLIADGAQAAVFENTGPGKGLIAVEGLKFDQVPLQAQELVSDRPGRSFSSVGSSRSAMESSSNPVQMRERRFVEHVAEALDRHAQRGDFDRLIIAAAPTALGDLRPALTKMVRDRVEAEMPKDLTNVPKAQLDTHFKDLLAL